MGGGGQGAPGSRGSRSAGAGAAQLRPCARGARGRRAALRTGPPRPPAAGSGSTKAQKLTGSAPGGTEWREAAAGLGTHLLREVALRLRAAPCAPSCGGRGVWPEGARPRAAAGLKSLDWGPGGAKVTVRLRLRPLWAAAASGRGPLPCSALRSRRAGAALGRSPRPRLAAPPHPRGLSGVRGGVLEARATPPAERGGAAPAQRMGRLCLWGSGQYQPISWRAKLWLLSSSLFSLLVPARGREWGTSFLRGVWAPASRPGRASLMGPGTKDCPTLTVERPGRKAGRRGRVASRTMTEGPWPGHGRCATSSRSTLALPELNIC